MKFKSILLISILIIRFNPIIIYNQIFKSDNFVKQLNYVATVNNDIIFFIVYVLKSINEIFRHDHLFRRTFLSFLPFCF